MKIKELQLERYGIYQEETWRPSLSELNVVMGENESGKTTMLSFIRQMLFGYERGRWQGNFGNMEILRGDAIYRIHRREKNHWIDGEKGLRHEEEPADLWWNGLTRNLYEKIFAVGLEDLQGSSFFFNDSVQSQFFMLQGGGKIIEAKNAVAKEKEKLFISSSMGKRKINQLLGNYSETQKEIDELGKEETNFAHLQKEQEKVKQVLHEKEQELKKAEKENKYIEKLNGAREYYKRGIDIKKQLEISRQVKTFPSHGKERWNEIINEMKVIDDQRKILQEKISAYEPKSKSEIIPWLNQAEELENIYAELGQWKKIIEDLHQLKEEKELWRKNFISLGYSLPLWDRPLSIDETVMDIDWEEGRQLAQSATVCENELHFREKREPKVEVIEEKNTVKPDISTEEEWRDYESKGENLEILIHKEALLTEEYKKLAEQKKSNYTLWFWVAIAFLAVSLGSLALFYLSLWGYEALYLAAACGGGAVLFAMVNRYSFRRRNKKIVTVEETLRQVTEEKKKLNDILGENSPHNETDLSAFHNVMQEKRSEFYRYRAEEQALAWRKETVKKQEKAHDEWVEEGNALHKRWQVLENQWKEWLKKNHLPEVSADKLLTLQEQWQKISAAEAKGKIWNVRLQNVEKEYQDFYDRAEKIIRTVGSYDQVTPERIAELYEENKNRNLEWERVAEKNHQHDMYKQELAEWDTKWKAAEKDLEALFALVDAADADEFVEKVNAYENHDNLLNAWQQVQSDIRAYAGDEETFAKLWNDLEKGDYVIWDAKQDHVEKEINTLAKDIGDLKQKQGAIGNEIMRLASDDTMTKLLQKKKEIETELEENMEDWLTELLVEKILAKAGGCYESGKQPEIVQKANEFLKEMTRGKYALTIDESGKDIRIIDDYHVEKSSSLWSSGTGDQVYLALRLSMALSFGKQIEALPIVLDDIFVRFDERRQKETLKFLLQLGTTQQIFLFTCHKRTMELAEEVGKEQHRGAFFNLKRGKITPVI